MSQPTFTVDVRDELKDEAKCQVAKCLLAFLLWFRGPGAVRGLHHDTLETFESAAGIWLRRASVVSHRGPHGGPGWAEMVLPPRGGFGHAYVDRGTLQEMHSRIACLSILVFLLDFSADLQGSSQCESL